MLTTYQTKLVPPSFFAQGDPRIVADFPSRQVNSASHRVLEQTRHFPSRVRSPTVDPHRHFDSKHRRPEL